MVDLWFRVINLFAKVKEHYGRIDAVVNSAGICENIPAIDYSAEKLHKVRPSGLLLRLLPLVFLRGVCR